MYRENVFVIHAWKLKINIAHWYPVSWFDEGKQTGRISFFPKSRFFSVKAPTFHDTSAMNRHYDKPKRPPPMISMSPWSRVNIPPRCREDIHPSLTGKNAIFTGKAHKIIRTNKSVDRISWFPLSAEAYISTLIISWIRERVTKCTSHMLLALIT